MKYIYILVYICINANLAFSQVKDTIFIFEDIEELPTHDNGYEEMLVILKDSVVYPQKAIADSVEGYVFLVFLVDTNGNTKKHKILKGIRDDLDNEALRVAKLIKFDKPAKIRGKPVEIEYYMPIKFSLPSKNNQEQKQKKRRCKFLH